MRLHIDLYAVFIEKIDNFCIRYYTRFLFDIVLPASGRGWVFRGSCLFEDKKKSTPMLIVYFRTLSLKFTKIVCQTRRKNVYSLMPDSFPSFNAL